MSATKKCTAKKATRPQTQEDEMSDKIIHEDEENIIYRETYQTHWNPDRIGGALTMVNKSAVKL